MICSSNTICTPDRHRLTAWLSSALFALAVMLGLMLGLPMAAAYAAPSQAESTVQAAKLDLQRGDGIAAEMRLKQALEKGADRAAVAAYMGEALLAQGESDRARDWLSAGEFSADSAAVGYRTLARLEQQSGNLRAAGAAFDRAISFSPGDASMWVEIGRLRYSGGEHLLAIDAASYALELEPENARALEFRGQLVRDSYGLAAALPWFETALSFAPDDVSLLLEYAATLGELGRNRQMLTLTRRVLELSPGNARAYYLQAVMAARAGNYGLARSLLQKVDGRLGDLAGAILLEGVTETALGNYTLAIEALEPLAKRQPGNDRVRNLFARALFLAGEHDYLVSRYAQQALQSDATPYLQTLIGRSLENLDRREEAARYLDLASRAQRPAIYPVADSTGIGQLLADGQAQEAAYRAETGLAADPGFYQNLELAGDVQLLLGRAQAAIERYDRAARIRMPESLMLRRVQAFMMAGDMRQASELVDGYLVHNPNSRAALRLAAMMSVQSGDWKRARAMLEFLRDNGSARDVQLLSDLALTQIRTGDPAAAEASAQAAYRLQRANPVAAQAWGLSLAALEKRPDAAKALLEKARSMMGDNPLLTEGRLKLAGSPQS